MLAKKWLGLVPEHQRRVDKSQVEKLTTAILAGEWRENGSTFVFDSKGAFIDGQHRAHAIVAANHPVWALLVVNVDSSAETFETIDDAKARSIRDFLFVPNATTAGAVARLYWLVENKHWPSGLPKVPIADCLKLAKPMLQQIGDSVRKTRAPAHVVGEHAFLAFLYFYYVYVLQKNESETVAEFFERLADGVNLSATSPTNLLRNRILGIVKRNIGSNFRLTQTAKRALIVKALNAELQNKTLKILSWDPGREPFPEFLK